MGPKTFLYIWGTEKLFPFPGVEQLFLDRPVSNVFTVESEECRYTT